MTNQLKRHAKLILVSKNDENQVKWTSSGYPISSARDFRRKMDAVLKVQDGQIVAMDYTLKIDGEVVDSSDGQEPLEFLQGAGNIIPGLEEALYGMAIGENKKVTIAPEDGYGEFDSEAFVDVPREEFPAEIPLEEDTEIQVTDQDGNPMFARIDSVSDEAVKLDFNHPLAGQTLNFDVTIVALRAATEEEMEHGHAHDGHEH
jgi:FKBP-type peptidyl-prolyl cis-trans isomerase SlyD